MPTFKKTEPKKVTLKPKSKSKVKSDAEVKTKAKPVIKKQPAQPKVNMTKPVLKPISAKNPNNPEKKPKKSRKPLMVFLTFFIILLGIGSGYGLTIFFNGTDSVSGLKQEKGLKREVSDEEIKVGTKVGVADESTFRDSAEGQVEKGGLDGEGSHKLIRPGGEDQTLYMTSSVIDLDQYVDRKVKIWGETIGSQKVGWLMDVGKLEVLE